MSDQAVETIESTNGTVTSPEEFLGEFDAVEEKNNKRGKHLKRYSIEEINSGDADLMESFEKWLNRSIGPELAINHQTVSKLVEGYYSYLSNTEQRRKDQAIATIKELAAKSGVSLAELVPQTGKASSKTK